MTALNELGAPRVLIGGQLEAAESGERYTTIDPGTEESIVDVPDCDARDVERAVLAAEAAQRAWRDTPLRERSAYVREMARVVRSNSDILAELDALDGGNPLPAAKADMEQAAQYIESMADLAAAVVGDTLPLASDSLHYTVHEPFGVVARINAYNHPLLFTAAKIAAPLLMGNTVVVKVPEQTPLSPLHFGQLMRDRIPAGCINILTGHGAELGQAVVRHPRIRRIAFTGSDATGRLIQADAAGVAVKSVSLELGGKNALLALADADPDQVGDEIIKAMNITTSMGQSCGSMSRVLVHESIAKQVLKRAQEAFESLVVGPALDPATDVGPMVSRAQYDKVLTGIEAAKADGATLVTGGGRPEGFGGKGFYVAPTIFTDVTPGMRIARTEIFGPVVAMMTFRELDEAIRLANEVDYGLTASVWTNDLAAAMHASRKLEAGYVWVNDSAVHYFGAPFGGYKNSGVGREEGVEELLSHCQTKSVHVLSGAR